MSNAFENVVKLRDTVSVKDFGAVGDGVTDDTAAIQAALTAQQSLGAVLVFVEGTYNIAAQITQTLTAPMVIYCDGPVTLNWSPATVTTHLWKITLAGSSFSNIGPGILTFQCNNKLSRGIDIINDTDASRPDVDLGNMRAVNLLSDNAVGFGISVAGKLGTVRGNRLEVDGLTRTTSAGSCQGIAIYRTSFTRAPLKVLIEDVVAKNISCPTADWDADGFLVYTNFEDGVEVRVKRASFYNCRGRGGKFQTGAVTPVIDDLYYYRDVAPVATTQSSKVVAGQYGALLVRQATIEFGGSSTHGGAGTTLFDVSHPGTDLTRGISTAMIENVTVFNNSSDTTPIEICSAAYTGSDTNERMISIKNLKVIGGTVKRVSSLLSLGQTNRTRFDIDGLIAPFVLSTDVTAANRGCLFNTNGSGTYLTGAIRGVINTTVDSDLPLVRDLAGAENPVGQFFDGGGNRGWKIDNGAAVRTVSGLQASTVAIGYPANYATTGFLSGLYAQTYRITDGATVVIPAMGYRSQGSGEFKVALHDYNAVGEYSIVGGSTTISAIRAAPSSVQIGSGSEPASGTLRIWKNGVNGPLNLKAVGDNVYVTLVALPV